MSVLDHVGAAVGAAVFLIVASLLIVAIIAWERPCRRHRPSDSDPWRCARCGKVIRQSLR